MKNVTSLFGRIWKKLDYNEIRRRIWNRDRWCVICGSCGYDVHHIVYRSHGGTNAENNLVLLCRACHRALHDDSPNLAMIKRGLRTTNQVRSYLIRYIRNKLWRLN